MKNYILALFVLFFSCSGKHNHDLTVYDQIDNDNRLILQSIENLIERNDTYAAVPQTKARGLAYKNKQNDILKACIASYQEITKTIQRILEDGGVEADYGISMTGFPELKVLSDEVDDTPEYNYTDADMLFNDMEKLANSVVRKMCGYYYGEYKYELKSYLKRPENIVENEKGMFEGVRYTDRIDVLMIANTLLIPQKHDNGRLKSEVFFKGQCLVSTLEQLNLFRQRILKACERALSNVDRKLDSPPYIFNKVEPIVHRESKNTMDSIHLHILLNAYDSTDVPSLIYTIDGGEQIRSNGSRITIPKKSKDIRGFVRVIQNAVIVWKPWYYEVK